MKAITIPKDFDHIAPDGAEVRELLDNHLGGIAHCVLKKQYTSNPTKHKSVSEFWHVLSGSGEIWRKTGGEESITPLEPGITIDIPVGTAFQYRSNEEELIFLCVTMPPWPGSDEACDVEHGAWEPSVK